MYGKRDWRGWTFTIFSPNYFIFPSDEVKPAPDSRINCVWHQAVCILQNPNSQLYSQGWEFAHSLIRSFAQIAQIKWATVSNTLRTLRTNEGLCANRSGRSCPKSDCERIARLLMTNERLWAIRPGRSWKMSELLVFSERIAHSLFCSQKTSDKKKNWLNSYFLYVFCMFFMTLTSPYKTSQKIHIYKSKALFTSMYVTIHFLL